MLRSTLIIIIIINGIVGDEDPTVEIAQGRLRGQFELSTKGRVYAAFKGIPYAAPPTGELRFRDPKPLQFWKGVWNATNYGDVCLQFAEVFRAGESRISGSEDCLYVNVFTPTTDKNRGIKKFDVIVFIHGGAFMWGSGNHYSPKNLMDRDVVFVTLNYRLNIFGFLSTEDKVLPGNLGLKDQNAALRWIKDNIEAFGGNRDSITITGLSAGGASVHYHYLSPLSHGLFNRGISFSGTAICSWVHTEASLLKAQKLAAHVGCPTASNKEMIDCVKSRPALQLVEQIESFQVFLFNPTNVFGPVVEKGAKNPFIDKSPIEIMRKGKAIDIPWITGITTEEGLYPLADFMANYTLVEEYNLRFKELAPFMFHYNFTIPRSKHPKVAEEIQQHYMGDKPFSRNTFKEMIKMVSDRNLGVDIERAARIHSEINRSPVYFFEYAYRGEHSFGDIVSYEKTNLGVCHGDDVILVIPYQFRQGPPVTKQDKEMIDRMLDFWTSYAKTGTPSFDGVEWKRVSPEATHYLRIENPHKYYMASTDDLCNRKFWDSLPIEEPQIGVMPGINKPEL